MVTITAAPGTKHITTPVGHFTFNPASGALTEPATLTPEQEGFLIGHAGPLGLTVTESKAAPAAPKPEAPAAELEAPAEETEPEAPAAELEAPKPAKGGKKK